jgi:hypothetical protein
MMSSGGELSFHIMHKKYQITFNFALLLLWWNTSMCVAKVNLNFGVHTGGFVTSVGNGDRYFLMHTAPYLTYSITQSNSLGTYFTYDRFRGSNLPSIDAFGVGIIWQYDWYNPRFRDDKRLFSFGSSLVSYVTQLKLTVTSNNLPLYIKSRTPIYVTSFVLPIVMRIKIRPKLNAELGIGIRQAEDKSVAPSGRLGFRYHL